MCRICGNIEILTEEHILPRAAGGSQVIKVFSGTEILKTLRKDNEQRPYGVIKQGGHTEFTLCRSCNNHSGLVYDKDFADFYNTVTYETSKLVRGVDLSDEQTLDDYLDNKQIIIKLYDIKPMNIAKRVLVSFCSVEHPGLTDDNPEVRKAIIDRLFKPDTAKFSLYMTPHIGSTSYFATMASIRDYGNGELISEAYAGIEIGALAFYLSEHNEHLKGGSLSKCINITNWLTDCEYDQKADVEIHGQFLKPLLMSFTSPEWK